MRDHIIRAAFHNSVLKTAHLDANTIVVDELGLKNGERRADIAVLNGKLIGYEIKTEKDTLIRLESQVKAYSEVFEQAYVITGEKHISKVRQLIPEWWGIYGIEIDQLGGIEFTCERKGLSNQDRDAYGIAQLLWKTEVAEILCNDFECTIKQTYTKHHLYSMLTEVCDASKLSNIAIKYLKHRQGWRINLQ